MHIINTSHPPFFLFAFLGMSHEPKSPSLGMISTATRTTATVSPLTPSPLNGSIIANGSPAAQSSHSGFAAALRKLAKQAEEPRGKAKTWCDYDRFLPCSNGCLKLFQEEKKISIIKTVLLIWIMWYPRCIKFDVVPGDRWCDEEPLQLTHLICCVRVHMLGCTCHCVSWLFSSLS